MRVEIIIVCLSLVLLILQPPIEISPNDSDGPTVPIELHLADSPWPMFRQNLNHTGLSEYDTSGNSGKLRWNFTTGDELGSSPAIGSDGTVYIGSLDWRLYATNPDGTEKWNFTTGNRVISSPAIGSDGTVYVGSNDHRLYAINPDGTEKWNFTTGNRVISSPAIGSDGIIYVGSDNNRLYAINPNGTLKWWFKIVGWVLSSPAIGSDGTVYIGSNSHRLYAINPNGTLKWWFNTGEWVKSSPAIGSDGTVYIGSNDRRLYAINPDGTEKWNFTTGNVVHSSPAIGSDGTVYVGSNDLRLYAINPDGTEKWNFKTGGPVHSSPAIGSDGTVYVGSYDDRLYAINPDGTEKWNFKTGGPVHSSPAIGSDGTVYVGSLDNRLYAIGRSQNQPPVADAGGPYFASEGEQVLFNASGSHDPNGDALHYSWDFDYDGMSFDVEATGQSVTHTWADDFEGEIALRVTDDDGAVGMDTSHVLVKNVPPTVTLEVLPIEADAFLRIAGEKWHDVSIELYEDGILMANRTLVRYPGSPDDQMLDLTSLQFDYSKKYSAIVRYTPEDDPINGQPNGANPCWIILNFSDGEELWIHHTFNVQHPESHIWEVDLTAAIPTHGLKFEATALDPGADDLAFHWEFGDGTNFTTFYPNVNETYPVEIMEIINHVFPGSGTYTVTVTVEDDDGGIGVATVNITIP